MFKVILIVCFMAWISLCSAEVRCRYDSIYGTKGRFRRRYIKTSCADVAANCNACQDSCKKQVTKLGWKIRVADGWHCD